MIFIYLFIYLFIYSDIHFQNSGIRQHGECVHTYNMNNKSKKEYYNYIHWYYKNYYTELIIAVRAAQNSVRWFSLYCIPFSHNQLPNLTLGSWCASQNQNKPTTLWNYLTDLWRESFLNLQQILDSYKGILWNSYTMHFHPHNERFCVHFSLWWLHYMWLLVYRRVFIASAQSHIDRCLLHKSSHSDRILYTILTNCKF